MESRARRTRRGHPVQERVLVAKNSQENLRRFRKSVPGMVGLAIGLGSLAAAVDQVGLAWGECARAALLLGTLILPGGFLLTRGLAPELTLPVERLMLAAVIGYPFTVAASYILLVRDAEAWILPLTAGAAVGVLARCFRSGATRRARGLDWGHPANFVLPALFGLVLLATSRGYRAFVETPAGLAYNHVFEHTIHLSMLWEMVRGLPPHELPTVAGLPFPHYHLLGYLPGVLLVRKAGLGVITVYHAVLPLLHLSLLTAGIYTVVRIRTRRVATALAAIVTVFFVVNVLESAFKPESFLGRVGLEFFVRSVSGGTGILVWTAVLALLAAYRPGSHQARPLWLAALAAGFAYGFKAQMFLLLGIVWAAVLLGLLGREKPARLLVAASLTLCGFALIFPSWPQPGDWGHLGVSWGAFVHEAGMHLMVPGLAHPQFWVIGTLLAVWLALNTPVLSLVFAITRWPALRRLPPLDAFLIWVFPVSFLLACGLVAREVQGETSALLVREALFAVATITLTAEIVLLSALLDRARMDGARIVLATAIVAALALLPLVTANPTHRGTRNLIVLSRGEQGALEYLRRQTPLESVVAQSRTKSFPDLHRALRGLDRFAVVAGLGGRRSVLEYYRPGMDARHNRQEDLRILFRTTQAFRGETLLRRYGVNYVLEYPQRRLRFESPLLHRVYESEGVRLYRFGEATPPPSGPLFAPPGLH